jgi:hypothetical protein
LHQVNDSDPYKHDQEENIQPLKVPLCYLVYLDTRKYERENGKYDPNYSSVFHVKMSLFAEDKKFNPGFCHHWPTAALNTSAL